MEMRLSVTGFRREHKYIYLDYDIYDNSDSKIDSYHIQLILDHPLPTKEVVTRVLTDFLKGYKNCLDTPDSAIENFLDIEVTI